MNQQIANVGSRRDVRQQVAHLVDGGEPLQDRHEPAVLPLRRVEVDDVVVEKVLARPGRHGEQLGARGVYQYGAQAADLAADVDGHAPT